MSRTLRTDGAGIRGICAFARAPALTPTCGRAGSVHAAVRSVSVSGLYHNESAVGWADTAGKHAHVITEDYAVRALPAEDALAQTQRDQLRAVVDLYKALGGGMESKRYAMD